MDIVIREITIEDLPDYKKMLHPSKKYHDFNGPYYGQKSEEEIEHHISKIRNLLLKGKRGFLSGKMIVDKSTNKIIGQVTWKWKSEETRWLEIGIIIYDETNWGKGIGYKAFSMWIDEIFDTFTDIVRIGCTTWSGNIGMMKLSEKIGLKKEAEYKKARIVKGEYYDSLSYGILKSDWYKLHK